MLQIIEYEFAHRDEKRWGNARTIENYANAIFGNYLVLHNAEGSIDSDCIPDNLRRDLTLISAQLGNSTSTTIANQPTVSSTLLSIDLTKNPADRRVTGKSQLKEKATGLLSSSNGEGTGFIISIPDRYILTCSHVIEDSNDLRFIMSCEREFETIAHVVWSSFEQDMALLQLDEIPDDACYVQIDCNIDQDPDPCAPDEMIKLILCSYPAGSILASTPTFSEGKIDNYEKQVQLPDGRCFDTIISAINATHGCSGGPVVRMSDFALVGILQGGLKEGNDQLITDIHQLLRNKNLDIKF